jgi:hypothetical protein
MKRSLIAFNLFFLLIANASRSQNAPQTNSANTYNEVFDKVLTTDRTIPVVEYKGALPRPRRQPENTSLVFDPERVSFSSTVRGKLNDHRYSDQAKIKFLKDVMAYKESDILADIEDYPSEYLVKNPEALQLIKDYFLKQPAGKETVGQYRWLRFQVNNAMPGYVELMEDYVKKRPSLQIICNFEGELVLRLIQAGRERIALDFMKVQVDEWMAGKKKYLYHGDREIDKNVFDLFCFSKNNDIRTEARQMLWKCLAHEWDMDLHVLAFYLDEKKAAELNKSKETFVPFGGNEKRIFDGAQVVRDLKLFGLGIVTPAPDLPEYWQFQVWRKGFDYKMQRIFAEIDRVRRPRRSKGDYPVHYNTVSWIWFEPILERIGIYDIEVQEVVEKTNDGFAYKLYGISNEATYKLEYKVLEAECQVERKQLVVKMINLLLMKKNVKERWVEVAAGEYFNMFGLFEPQKIKPFFNKYQTNCYAVYEGDEFDKLK